MKKVTMVECSQCGDLTENNGFEPICDECEEILKQSIED